MLININIHSVFNPYFNELNFKADLNALMELHDYLGKMHPLFAKYLQEQQLQGAEEGFSVLDENLQELRVNNDCFRRFDDGETIYIVPAIYGGGGKRGGLLALFAIAAIFFAPFAIGALGTGAGSTAVSTAMAAKTGVVAKAFAGIKASSFLSNIVANIGLSLLSSIFSRPPETDSNSARENLAFSGMQNTIDSNTPVALHYGLVRVAGQLISGYVDTVDHEKGEFVSVYSRINPS